MKKIVFASLFLISTYIYSQENAEQQINYKGFFVGLEAANGISKGSMRDYWDIRQDISTNSYDYGSSRNENSIFSNANENSITLCAGYAFNKTIELASGIRFHTLYTEFESSAQNGFFYIRYKNDELNSEYARLTNISQNQYFLTIPINIKLTPLRYKMLSLYFKLGCEIGANIYTKNDFGFKQPELMDPHKAEIMSNFDMQPSQTFSLSTLSIGSAYTLKNLSSINMDFIVASSFLTKNNSSLLDLKRSFNFALSYIVPISVLKNKTK